MSSDEALEFLPVPLRMFVIDSTLNFNLYLFNPDRKRYVLFCDPNQNFTDYHRRKLIKNKIPEMYVHFTEYDAYVRYIERYLGRILRSEELKSKEKVQLVFFCANVLMEDTLKKPSTPDALKRSSRFVKNVVHLVDSKDTYLKRFRDLIEKDYTLSIHSRNVCIYSLAIARGFDDFSFDMLEILGVGSLLHDVGMTEMPEELLTKREMLTSDDWEVIQSHPERGRDLVGRLSAIDERILEIIYYHHERLDGTGYPDGMTKESIPLHVQIVALADVFDAIHSDRPYRKGLSLYESFQTIVDEYENKVDFKLVKNFVPFFAS